MIAAGVNYTLASKTSTQLPIGGGMVSTFTAIIAFIITILGWLLSTIIFHGFSIVLGGKGSFNKMIVLSGYAYTPMVIQQVLRLGYFSIVGPVEINLGIGQVGGLLNYFTVFSILTMFLVGVAVMTNYGLSGRKAALVALSPTLLIILLALALRPIMGNSSNLASRGGLLTLFRR